jgi:hypothetical protein
VRSSLLLGAAWGVLLILLPARALPQRTRATPPSKPPVSSGSKAVPPSGSQSGAKAGSTASPGDTKDATDSASAGNRGKQRDPFRTLMPEKKVTEELPTRLPPGKKGLVIEQLQLQGVARAVDGSWIAVVDNKNKRSYFLHDKDELYDGVVSKVMPDRVVFQQNVKEAAGRVSSREIVKQLSPQ